MQSMLVMAWDTACSRRHRFSRNNPSKAQPFQCQIVKAVRKLDMEYGNSERHNVDYVVGPPGVSLAHNHKTNQKAMNYARLADPPTQNALLVAFSCDAHGGFHPFDLGFAPIPHPRLVLGKLYCRQEQSNGRAAGFLLRAEGYAGQQCRSSTLLSSSPAAGFIHHPIFKFLKMHK